MPFNKQAHLIKVQGGRTYLPVAARIIWFREVHPDGCIETIPLQLDHEKQVAIFRAVITDAEGRILATATKSEDAKGFPDFLEKAETGAIGRALSLCGLGTDGDPFMLDRHTSGAAEGKA